MASKIISSFVGPITPTSIEEWLAQCKDNFEIYAATKGEKSLDLTVKTKICLTGTQLQDSTAAAWWNAGRMEFLKLESWEEFAEKIWKRFMAKGYKLMALCAFFLCSQGKLPFADYAAILTEACNFMGTTTIPSNIFKYQLLFHSHTILLLCIMAIPDFNSDTITIDALISLMSMQWESIVTENPGKISTCPAPPSTPSLTTSIVSPSTVPLLTDSERTRLTNAGGCWKCRKVPTDPGWVKHVVCTCPGDAALGIAPGRDYVPVKTEIAESVFISYDPEDQPDKDNTFYADDNTLDESD
ncbi:hypothetical protein C0991_004927 [Blastosporella zonata]|nr:hypothetical protein C0991_004927 [Blastosporella zonata]